ncbi:MAG: PEP-CTERM sorting domain-containing protein, partial [Planctomycetota bacterium]
GNSDYTDSTTIGAGPSPTITGGLITVNAAPVPEPSTWALAAIATATLAALARRRQRA